MAVATAVFVVASGFGPLAACQPFGRSQGDSGYHPGLTPSRSASEVVLDANQVSTGASLTVTVRLVDFRGAPYTAQDAALVLGLVGGSGNGVFTEPAYLGGGIYSSRFTGSRAGTPQQVVASVQGQPLTHSAPTLQVVGGDAVVLTSFVLVEQAVLAAGDSTRVLLVLRDAQGSLASGGGGRHDVAFSATVTTASAGAAAPSGGAATSTAAVVQFSPVSQVELDDGSMGYQASVQGVVPARMSICASVDGAAVGGQCPLLTVRPGVAVSLQRGEGNQQTGLGSQPLPAALSVLARDALGNVVPNTAVVWSASEGDAQISNLGGVTGPDGRALGVWRLGAEPGRQTASVALQDGDGGGAATTTLGAVVDFEAFALSGTPDATTSTIASSPAGGSWVADGLTSAAVVVTLRDALGNPVAGGRPRFAAQPAAASDVLTDCDIGDRMGRSRCGLSTTVAGARQLLVTEPIALDGNSLALLAGPPALAHSQLLGPAAAAVADGSTPASLRLLLRDVHDNRCANLPLSALGVVLDLSDPSGAAQLGPVPSATDARGEAAWSVTSIRAGPVGAQLSGPAALVGVPAVSCRFVSGPPVALSWVRQPGGAVSGAAWSAAPRLRLQDAQGNAVTTGPGSSATVGLSLSGAGDLGGASRQVLVAGEADFSGAGLQLGVSGPVWFLTATLGDAGGLTTHSAVFSVAPGPAASLRFAASPSGGQAPETWVQQPVVEVVDAAGNLVSQGADATLAVALSSAAGGLVGSLSRPAVGGRAVFTALRQANVGMDLSLRATAPSQAGAGLFGRSQIYVVTPGPPAALAWQQQPAAGQRVDQALSPAARLVLQDGAGNPIATGVDAAATVSLGLMGQTGPLLVGGATSRPLIGGIVDFDDVLLRVDRPAVDLQLVAQKADARAGGGVGPLSAISNPFTVTAGAAAGLAFATAPADQTAGAMWPGSVRVSVLDGLGNPLTSGPDAAAPITLGLVGGGGPGPPALSGTTSVAAVAGEAVFSGLSAAQAGVGLQLQASKPDTTPGGSIALSAVSSSFSLATGPAAGLLWTTLPASVVAGAPWAPAAVLSVVDAAGNVVATGAASTLSVTASASALPGGASVPLGGTLSRTLAAGQASFADMILAQAPASVRLSASGSLGGTTLSSAPISLNVRLGAGAQLALSRQPVGGTADAPLAAAPRVQVLDGQGNLVTTGADASGLVHLSLGGGDGSLLGTVGLQAVGGVADFAAAGLTVRQASADKVLTASAQLSGGPASVASSPFTVSAGAAACLAFTQQPGGGESGAVWATQGAVALSDAFANAVASGPDATASLQLVRADGASLLGSGGQTLSGGQRALTNLASAQASPAAQLVASLTTGEGASLSATSLPFAISAGLATRLVFAARPTGAVANLPLFPAAVVRVEDAAGNLVTTGPDATADVALSLAAGGGVLAASGALTVPAALGLADFGGQGVNLSQAGTGQVLRATKSDQSAAGGAGVLTADAPALSTLAGPAAVVQVAGAPAACAAGASWPTVTVSLTDAAANPLLAGPDAAADITLTTEGACGPLLGTTSRASSAGVATFPGLHVDVVDRAGGLGSSCRLVATKADTRGAGGTDELASPATTVTLQAGPAAALRFVASPNGGTTSSPWLQQPAVRIDDSFGNLATGGADAGLSVALTLSGLPGALAGTATASASAGVATFTGLSTPRSGAALELVASATSTAGSSLSATSSPFAVQAGAPASLVFTRQPVGGLAAAPLAQAPALQVLDADNNPVTLGGGAAGEVRLSLTSGSGALSGTQGRPVSAGVVDFAGAGLMVDKVGGGKQLTATFTSVEGSLAATSAAFSIAHGPGAQLAFVSPPDSAPATAGQAFAVQPVVQVLDAGGNVVDDGPDATRAVTLSLASGQPAVGASPLAASAGAATFAALSAHQTQAAEAWVATATLSGGSASIASPPFAVVAALAWRLRATATPTSPVVALEPLWPAPAAEVVDAYDNRVVDGPDASPSMTLTLGGGGSLLGRGPLIRPASGGWVDFAATQASLDTAGPGRVLTVTKADTRGGGGTDVMTLALPTLTVTPAAAAELRLLSGPVAMVAGLPPASPTQVQVVDAAGNVVTTGPDATATVTLSVVVGGGLGGTISAAASAGVATFAGYTLSATGPGVILRFTKADTTGSGGRGALAVNAPGIVVSPGPISQLMFTSQPGAAVAGQAWALQPVLKIADAGGNLASSGPDSNLTVSLSMVGAPGALSPIPTTVASGGVATFSALQVAGASPSRRLRATATTTGGTALSVDGIAFPVLAAAPTTLAFTRQPGGGLAAAAWATQPALALFDAYGNPALSGPGSDGEIFLSMAAGTGRLSGNTLQPMSLGVSDFAGAGLSLDLVGSNKQLRAQVEVGGRILQDTSTTFAVAHNVGAQLVFASPPATAVAGVTFSPQPVVRVLDAGGNLVDDGADANAPVALTLSSGQILYGSPAASAAAGVASFAGLSARQAQASEAWVASATLSGVVTTVTSAPFFLPPAPASALRITGQPSTPVAALSPLSPGPACQVVDAFGNLVDQGPDASAQVTAVLSGGSGTLQGQGILTRAAVGGVADFASLAPSLDTVGTGKVLTLIKADTSGSGGTGAASAALAPLTVVPGAADMLAFGAAPVAMTSGLVPTSATQVRILDAAGNVVTTGADAAATVSVSVVSDGGVGGGGGGGVIGGTTSAAATGGVASLSAFTLSGTGAAVRLRFTKADTTGMGGTPARVLDAPPVVVSPGAASQLVFVAAVGGAVAGEFWSVQPAVRLLDVGGNLISSGADSSLTVSLSLVGGPAALLGTPTAVASAGVATFTGVQTTVAHAARVLRASATTAGGATLSVDGSPFAVLAATPAALAFTRQPGGGLATSTWASQPALALFDAYGNLALSGPGSDGEVALSMAAGTGVLSGARARAAAAGVVDFAGAGLALDRAGSDKQLRAQVSVGATTLTAISTAFAVAHNIGAQLAFAAPPSPSPAVAGVAFPVQPTVHVLDAGGNLVTGGADANAPIGLALSSGQPLHGSSPVRAVAGVSSFGGLSARQSLGAEAWVASATLSGAAATLTSPTFVVAAAPAAGLRVTGQPSTPVAALSPLSPAPGCQVVDAFDNPVVTGADATAAVTLSLTGGTGSVAGRTWLTHAAVSGAVDFGPLAPSLDTAGTGKVLTLTKADTSGSSGGTAQVAATLTPLTVVPGAAAELALGAAPVAMTAGLAPSLATQVRIVDAAGNLVATGADATAMVAVSVVPDGSDGSGGGSGSGGAIGGTTSVAAVGGVATLSAFTLSGTGAAVRLRFTKADTTGGSGSGSGSGTGAMVVDAPPVVVSPGAASQLVFAAQPRGAVAGANWGVQPVVRVADAGGNLIASGPDSSLTVSLSLVGAPGAFGTVPTLAASAGVAAFTGVQVTGAAPSRVLRASATSTGGTSLTVDGSAFAVLAGTPSSLTFTRQPGGGLATAAWASQPALALFDAYGNPALSGPGSDGEVFLSVAAGLGALSGTRVRPMSLGVVDFAGAGLSLDLIGSNKQLRAQVAVGGTTIVATSTAFSVAHNVGAQLAFVAPASPAVAGVAFPVQPAVRVLDAGGNLVDDGADASAAVSLSLSSGQTLYGSTPVGAVAGVTTFSGLSARLAQAAEAWEASATLSGAAKMVTSGPFALWPAAAAALQVTGQPTTPLASLSPLSPAPAAQVVDAYNNVVVAGPDATADVTLSLSGGSGHVLGRAPLIRTAAAGVVTFAPLAPSLDTAGAGKQLTLTKADTTGANGTGSFSKTLTLLTVSPSAAEELAFAAAPAAMTAGLTPSTATQVRILDAAGNLVTAGVDATATVSVALVADGGGGGTLGGTTSVAAVGGAATLSGYTLSGVGSAVRLRFSKADTTGGGGTPAMVLDAPPVGVSPGAATQLAYAAQPRGAVAGQAWAVQPVVRIIDAGGHPIVSGPDSALTLSLSLVGAPGALGPIPTAAASAGVAAFTGLRVDGAAASRVLRATATTTGGTTLTVDGAAFAVLAATPTALTFTRQPGGGLATAAWATQPALALFDAYGNPALSGPGSDGEVVLSVATGTGVLSGTTLRPMSLGVVDFAGAGLSLDLIGSNKQLRAEMAVGGTPVAATSTTFTVAHNVGAQLAFAAPPSGAVAGVAFPTQPRVSVLDAGGNLVDDGTDNNASISLALSSGQPLYGSIPIGAAAGVATFDGLSARLSRGAEAWVASATLSGVAKTATSAAFPVVAAPASALRVTGQPTTPVAALSPLLPAPGCQVVDAFNNPVVTGEDATASVTLTLTGGSGSVLGRAPLSRAAVAGLVDFTPATPSLDTAGTAKLLTLTKADTSGSGGTTSFAKTLTALTVTPGAPSELDLRRRPRGDGGGPRSRLSDCGAHHRRRRQFGDHRPRRNRYGVRRAGARWWRRRQPRRHPIRGGRGRGGDAVGLHPLRQQPRGASALHKGRHDRRRRHGGKGARRPGHSGVGGRRLAADLRVPAPQRGGGPGVEPAACGAGGGCRRQCGGQRPRRQPRRLPVAGRRARGPRQHAHRHRQRRGGDLQQRADHRRLRRAGAARHGHQCRRRDAHPRRCGLRGAGGDAQRADVHPPARRRPRHGGLGNPAGAGPVRRLQQPHHLGRRRQRPGGAVDGGGHRRPVGHTTARHDPGGGRLGRRGPVIGPCRQQQAASGAGGGGGQRHRRDQLYLHGRAQYWRPAGLRGAARSRRRRGALLAAAPGQGAGRGRQPGERRHRQQRLYRARPGERPGALRHVAGRRCSRGGDLRRPVDAPVAGRRGLGGVGQPVWRGQNGDLLALRGGGGAGICAARHRPAGHPRGGVGDADPCARRAGRRRLQQRGGGAAPTPQPPSRCRSAAAAAASPGAGR